MQKFVKFGANLTFFAPWLPYKKNWIPFIKLHETF
jgi:hypothetical protein